MTTADFYKAVFIINGDSFNGMEQYETMPYSKFIDLVTTYNNLSSERAAAIDSAKKR